MKNNTSDFGFRKHKTDEFLASAILVALLIITVSCAVGFGWLQG